MPHVVGRAGNGSVRQDRGTVVQSQQVTRHDLDSNDWTGSGGRRESNDRGISRLMNFEADGQDGALRDPAQVQPLQTLSSDAVASPGAAPNTQLWSEDSQEAPRRSPLGLPDSPKEDEQSASAIPRVSIGPRAKRTSVRLDRASHQPSGDKRPMRHFAADPGRMSELLGQMTATLRESRLAKHSLLVPDSKEVAKKS